MFINIDYLDFYEGKFYKNCLCFEAKTFDKVFLKISTHMNFIYTPNYLLEYLKENKIKELTWDYIEQMIMENNEQSDTSIILKFFIDDKLMFEDDYKE